MWYPVRAYRESCFLAPEEGLQIITFSVGKTAVLGLAMQVPPSVPNGPPAPEPAFEFAEPENDDEMSDSDTSPGARIQGKS